MFNPTSTFTKARRSGSRGFTLIEAMLTTVIIGVGVMAMMQLLASGTVNNIEAAELTSGMNIAKSIHEIALQKKMTQIVAMNGTSHQPPWDSRSKPIADLANWKQTIAVNAVNPDNLKTNIVDATPSAVRLTVTVLHNGKNVCSMSWYTFDGTP
jgi:prepilin-type N-terminal cleavage/methylation domain-containing protein